MERKLELERIYKEYCSSGIEHLKEDYQVDYEFFSRLVEFRLSVSGGSESTMGDIGMNFISGFLVSPSFNKSFNLIISISYYILKVNIKNEKTKGILIYF